MKRRSVYAAGLTSCLALMLSSIPASAAGARPSVMSPLTSIDWSFRHQTPLAASRFDGEYLPSLDRVYFLGARTLGDQTDGSVWYYSVGAKTYTNTGIQMPVPISNYGIAALTDSGGRLGLYIFGGRDANAAIVDTTQVYYPDTNTAEVVATDPWPGTTPSSCISLPAMGVATLDNHAYVLGGLSFAANGCVDDQSAQTWIFDPTASPGARWTQGPNLHQARGYITPAVLNGRIYAIGGDTNVGGAPTPQVTVEGWQPPATGWIDAGINDLPMACDESQAFPFETGPLAGDIVFAYCGQWPNAVPDTLLYDTLRNRWSESGAMNHNRRNAAGAFVPGNQRILVFGGYGEPSAFIDPIRTVEAGKPGASGQVGHAKPPPGSGGMPTVS